MNNIKFLPKKPLKKLKKVGLTYADFARMYDFDATAVRQCAYRFKGKKQLPRINSEARLIIIKFFEATCSKVD